MAVCGGLDWGGSEHGVCVVDRLSGQIVVQFAATHDAAGLADRDCQEFRVWPGG